MLKIFRHLYNFCVAISVYTITIYDDIIFSLFISNKEALSAHLNTNAGHVYHISTLYLLGFGIGSIFWNIMIRKFSIKRIMVFCILGLIISMITIVQTQSVLTLMIIRCANGFLVTGPFICVNTLMKNSVEEDEFSHFLATSIFFNCIAEGMIIKCSDPLITRYGFKAIPIFLIVIFIFGLLVPFSSKYKDIQGSSGIVEATSKTINSYTKIVNSKLILILFLAGMSEGMIDLIFTLVEPMILNINTGSKVSINNALAIISIASSIYVNLVSYLSKEKSVKDPNHLFNWKILIANDDSKKALGLLGLSIIVIIAANIRLEVGYLWLIGCMSVLTGIMYTINYFCAKILYECYQNPACVASSILLFQAFTSMTMQRFSEFSMVLQNYQICLYFLFYLVLMIVLFTSFYYLLYKNFKQSSCK